MPVFDFSSASEEKEAFVCTYTAFTSDSSEKTPDDPILVLDNQQKQWSHHSTGVFCNQSQWTAFEFKEEDETFRSNILRIDARFVNLIKWLGENHINVLLSGENRADGYAVYKIRENAFHGGTKLSAADGFLQYVMERLLSSSAPEQEDEDEELDESGDSMKLTSIQSISDFYELRRKNHAGQYQTVGEKKFSSCTFPRSVCRRNAATRSVHFPL